MFAFFETLVKICFFKSQPQDLPAGRQWVIIATVLIVAATVLAGTSKNANNSVTLFALAQIALYAAAVWLVLKTKSFHSRWPQTITALFGTSFILQLISLPFVNDIPLIQDGQLTINNSFIIIICISFWSLIVVGHILKNAMEIPFFAAFIVGFVVQAISLALAASIIGPSVAEPLI